MKTDVKRLGTNDIDYKYYLGAKYRQEYKDPAKNGGKVSTLVCNHCSAIDIDVLLSTFKGHLAFVAGTHVLGMPGLCAIVKAIGCITMPMGGSDEAKEQTANLIEQRQEMIENGSEYVPFVIFPEGTCSNNTCLLPFRKGAFGALRTVIPITIKYKWTWFQSTIDVIDESIAMPFLCMGFSPIIAEVTIMPPFQPNEYLFKTHGDKGDEKWEIYAWAVRDLMAKVGGFGKHDQTYRDKIALYRYFTG